MDPIDGKQDAIAQVEGGAFPIWLGQGRPQAAIIEEDGRFRIRAVVVDPQAVAAASTPRTRTPSWMPVHQVARGWPGGEIFAEAASREELVEVIRAMPWPPGW
ncbi:MAG: hypothetical protein KBG28_17425 [Kofleriaceae bacterium]|jgi:hypothetical protein|nr:hypothetical protein [Kofleriaceae bacterium]MBP6838925.1 hypothetical protein [Kofleriaceae bacterium]MBP9205758.1 hypothetical protein [Kofleriaceae bacterium]